MNEYDTEGNPEGPQRKRHGSATFYKFLHEMAEIHDAKSHDYTNTDAPFANYEFAGNMAIMFSHSPIDAGFAGRLAEKLYRLYVLESNRKIPKNESIADTERDIAVIATLWQAARRDAKTKIDQKLAEEKYKQAIQEHEARKNAVYGGARAPGKTAFYEQAAAAPKQETAASKAEILAGELHRTWDRESRLRLIQNILFTI
jgi:hypothetical protein